MPRLPRIHLEGAIYYVTARCLQNEKIFKDEDDYAMYLELVSKYKTQHKFKLFSYNLHADNLELLIETGDDASISDIMHDLNSLYTKYFNGRYQKRGPLFESRFKSVLVEKANYLLQMTRHIHSKDNSHSSFHVYIATSLDPLAKVSGLNISEEVKEVLGRLNSLMKRSQSAQKASDARRNLPGRQAGDADEAFSADCETYERYVLEDKQGIEELEKSLRRAQVLGLAVFEQEVKAKIQQHAQEQKQELIPAKRNPVVIVMVGALVLVASASAVLLYVDKQKIEDKYTELLKQKEQEFIEKSRFENRSPLAPMELDGTRWEVEVVPQQRSGVVQKDTITFKDGRFESEEMAAKGFRSSNYFLVPQGRGVVLWQAAQSNASGDTVTWRGTWQGEAMKGNLTLTTTIQTSARPSQLTFAEDFSFFSVNWAYAKKSQILLTVNP